MDIQSELILSYYKEITQLNAEHHVALVQHKQTNQIYVKKTLDVFNLNVYSYLKDNPIPGIPRIYEIVQHGGSLIIIEDYISGQSLEQILSKEGPLPEDKVAKYTLQLCDTVSRLHASIPSIIHRDIKPTNVIITPYDSAILIDLNAAKHASDKSEDTTLLGTRGYAAPEQYGFGSSGIQTDIYAIGMLMNTMLNGSFSQQVVDSHYTSVIQKCTELNPAHRYSSVEELKKALSPTNSKLQISRVPESNRRFLPPGFRTGNYANMLISSAYYIFVIWLSWDMKFKDANEAATVIQRFGVFFLMLSIPFSTLNYADIHRKFPFCNSGKLSIKILGIILLNFVVMLSILFIMLIFVSIVS